MEDWVLTSPPLAVCIWNWWALWQHAAQCPVEQVWVVAQRLHVEGVIVHDNWAVVLHALAETSDDEVHDVEVGNPAARVEILDGQLTDQPETKPDSELSTTSVVSIVEVRSVDWSRHLFHLASWEPRCNLKLVLVHRN